MKNITYTYTMIVKSPQDERFIRQVLEGHGIETVYTKTGDQTNKDFFAVTRWAEADVGEALIKRDIEPTKENIQKVMTAERVIKDRLVETGWEVLDTIIGDGYIDFDTESDN